MSAKKVPDKWKLQRGDELRGETGPAQEIPRDQLRAHQLLVSASYDVLDATCKMLKKKRDALNFHTEVCMPGPDGKIPEMLRPLYQSSTVVPVSQLEDAAKVIGLLLEQEKLRARFERGGCLNCGRRLTPGKRKYCGRKCTNAFLQRKHRNKLVVEEFVRGSLRLSAGGPDALVISQKPKK